MSNFIEKAVSVSAIAIGRIAGRHHVIGYVERIDDDIIEGWVLARDGREPRLSLRLGADVVAVSPQWVERADVSAKYGGRRSKPGFRIDARQASASLPATERSRIREVEVLAGDHVLTSLIAPVQHGETLPAEQPRYAVAIPFASRGLEGLIEEIGYFNIVGKYRSKGNSIDQMEVWCNGTLLDCPRHASSLAAPNGVVADEQSVFTIEIPGAAWELIGHGDAVRLQLRIDGESLLEQPITLSPAKARNWIKDIARMKGGREQQYRALLAIEHMHYRDFFPDLDARTQRFFAGFAKAYSLDRYLFGNGGTALGEPVKRSAEGMSTLMLWRALGALNELMRKPHGAAFPLVEKVLREQWLWGGARRNYLLSALSELCKSNEVHQLRGVLDFEGVKPLAESDNVWQISVALAVLAADGNFGRATGALYRAAEHLNNGWMSTECIHYAVRCLTEQSLRSEIDVFQAEKLRYAFVHLIDTLGKDSFSRQYDYELIEAAVEILRCSNTYTDYHEIDMVKGAIRNYGLCPRFWERLEQRGVSSPELARAREQWGKISRLLEPCDISVPALPADFIEAANYFARYQNPNLDAILRETLGNALSGNREIPVGVRDHCIEMLLNSDPREAVRIAAFPMEEPLDVYAETIDSRAVKTRIREMTDRKRSPFWGGQVRAAQLLRRAREAAARGDGAELNSLLTVLSGQMSSLNHAAAGILYADLALSCYELSRQTNEWAQGCLARFHDQVLRLLDGGSTLEKLPAPVIAGLAHLRKLVGNEELDAVKRELFARFHARVGEGNRGLLTTGADLLMTSRPGGWPFDTLVVIYTCRKYLCERGAKIRETWLRDVQHRGIPYVFLVGDGDDTIDGDVLQLDVSDLYEDLPQKSLRLFDWVLEHTDFQYVLKIDDDCYLNVDEFFDSLSYRKHDYYGRILRRAEGQMDRAWHQSKSARPAAARALDKSPEPAVYADGGGAYTLSRFALLKLKEVRETLSGGRLIASSFMEDKLIGDLLAIAGIVPSDEDYESCQRRRTFPGAMPITMWENTFFPGLSTVTKVVHLDSADDMPAVHRRAKEEAVWPKKIWPTCRSPSVGYQSNQLELISDIGRNATLLRERIVVVSVVRNERVMVPHFLAHYRALGIRSFIIVDNCSDDGTREYLHEQPDVVLYSCDTDYNASHYGVEWQRTVLGNFCVGKWVLLADTDELLVFPGCESRGIADLVSDLEREGADAVRVDMIDMYPSGDLALANLRESEPFAVCNWFDADPLQEWVLGSGYFSSTESYLSKLRHRLAAPSLPNGFTSQKFALVRYRPWMRFSEGLHYAANVKVSRNPAWFAHFKYHAGFKEKVITEIQRGQHFNNAAEYRRYAVMLAEGQGGFGNSKLSTTYQGSASFSSLPGYVVGDSA